ncbi:hypothetical protein As57867_019147, partial [Aphanomyces stellatus]
MNNSTIVLDDTGANMSVNHSRLVDHLQLPVDTSDTTGIKGFGDGTAGTTGTVAVKLTIGHGLVYRFRLAVCDFGMVGFQAILGMDFLNKAGIVIDTAKRELG